MQPPAVLLGVDVPVGDPAYYSAPTPTGGPSVTQILAKGPVYGGDGASIADSFGGLPEAPAWMRPYIGPLDEGGLGLLEPMASWIPAVTLGAVAVTGAVVIANKYWLHYDLGPLGNFAPQTYPLMDHPRFQYYANGPYPGTAWAPQEAGWYLFDTSGIDYRAYVTDDFLNCPPRDCSDVYEQHQAWDYWSANTAGTTSTGIIPPPNGVDRYLFRWVSRTTFPSYVRPDSAVQPWTGTGPQAGPPILAHIGWGTGVITDSNGDPVGVGSPEPGIGIATSDPIAVQNWLNCQVNKLEWACPDPNGDVLPTTQGTGIGGTGGYIGDGDDPSGPGDRPCTFALSAGMTWKTAMANNPTFYGDACAEAWAAAEALGIVDSFGLPTDATVAGAGVEIVGKYLGD